MSNSEQLDLLEGSGVGIQESSEDKSEPTSIRDLILDYIEQRKSTKLKAKGLTEEKIKNIHAEHDLKNWLAINVARIRLVRPATHTAKYSNPSVRASPIVFEKKSRPENKFIDSASLSILNLDVQCDDPKGLGIYNLLRKIFQGESLLDRLKRGDFKLQEALSDDPIEAENLMNLLGVFFRKEENMTAGDLSKQVYFSVEQGYHLLTLLYPTSLVHEVWRRISDARFGEVAKAMRDLRRNNEASDEELAEYPNLLVQGFARDKPQNISQLNLDRRGTMWLLPSLPPIWRSAELPIPRRSLFAGSLRGHSVIQQAVWRMAHRLHLAREDENNLALREYLTAQVQTMVDELIVLVTQLQSWPAGWTTEMDASDRLSLAQQVWLDPQLRFELYTLQEHGYTLLPEHQAYLDLVKSGQWVEEVGQDFGEWLVNQLKKHLKKSRSEFQRLDENEIRAYGLMLRNELKLMEEVA